ncbi:MFS transporter [Roseateles terrae]|uniref:Sugar phosphate permease n=1 Tax=Roseateles terrae TaxID=431060 RepID=A0ABR6GTN5_9BURK|nr:MFS transporter [Roseateles terrae]MBB3195429.1 sugar phosphate permease [Roseateles terrae]OWQ87408.1 MFS transporter [Roseateles terrae]
MLAQPVAAALGRRGVHYGWVVAAVTFLAMLTTSAALGLPGAMLQPLSHEFGWTTDQLASVFAVRFALFGLLGPFAALFIARFGLSRIMVVAASFIGVAMGLATQVTQLWQLFLLWGLVLGCGTGLTALVLGAMVANRWFTAHRGLVVGLFAASTATGQLLFLPAAAWIIEHMGWRYAVLPIMVACIGVATLALLFMRNQPRDVGLRPVGEPADAPLEAPLAAAPLNFLAPFTILAEAARHRTFWVLAASFFICGLSTNGLVQTHFISLCSDNGLAAVPAASVLAMMGAFDLVGTTLSGYLSDRYDNRKLLFWYYALRGLSLFWLPFSTFTLYGLSLFAMFYGLDWIATVPPTVKLTAQAFGKEKAGLVFGWVFAAHQLGAAAAAYGAGLTRTLLLTYNPALFAAGAACLVAALLVLRIRRFTPAR